MAQETSSQVSGSVKSEKNERLAGATITLVHCPTKNTLITQSHRDGRFYFTNLKPGGPYTLSISYVGFETLIQSNLFIELSYNETKEFILKEKRMMMDEVVATAPVSSGGAPGTEMSINSRKLSSLPTISRNLQDFVRLVPQSKVNGDGMMSLAGQNNKFNAFFIDGSNNNDILGIAMSGTNGGQTNTPPVSVEALDEIKILLAPYNVQYSNFTGGSINAITKSGSNEVKASAWYYFRNENMAGRSPVPLEKSGSPGVYERPRLSHFFNQTFGFWTSGPLVKNKLFYFVSAEKQLESRPQIFNFSQYRGSATQQQLDALADTLWKRYQYDPGSFRESKEELNATRTIIKADWNLSANDKFTASYRYNLSQRTDLRATSSTLIAFENNGFIVPARTHALSLEWKRYFRYDVSNRLLVTYTHQKDDRQIRGNPFPQVIISDGPARIFLGSHAASQFSLFKAADATLLDIVKFIKGRNNISFGADLNFTKISDLIIAGYFGSYQFRNLNDFMTNQFPSRFSHSFVPGKNPTTEDASTGSRYTAGRLGFFINDEISLSENLGLNIGLRVDGNTLPRTYPADRFYNDTAAKIISGFYNLEGAVSGRAMEPYYQLAPRLGITYKIPGKNLTLRGGAGIFSGRILNLWASEIYNSSLGTVDIEPALFGMYFIADAYRQPTYETLGLDASTAKGTLTLISKHFKYPAVFRSSLSAEKKWNKGWTLTSELLFTKNIHEWKVTNVNLLPPSQQSTPPDSRWIYPTNAGSERIPLRPNGTNPYTRIFLISNNQNRKGYSYSFSLILDKALTRNLYLTAAYSYGHSVALFEPYATAGPLEDQWVQSETVNGKNFTSLSLSDMDPGHRVYGSFYKKFDYWKHTTSTAVSLFYNGQSGQPYSYVYANSLVNDAGPSDFDLIYIPTREELNHMFFVPNTVDGITYTGKQQKQLLDAFIEADRYLNKHRGQFAKRNGARLPFTHTVDLRIQQDFKTKLNKKETIISVIYDIFNFTNLLNKNWGRTYSLSFDNYALITFAGFAPNTLTPQYQFKPINGKVYSMQSSTAPGNSARWISQLGIRVSF